ncbi:MAG: exo-alpha-sialidase [Dehalococcoidia bacterium]|nr:exo-alpha-sialidase [Dehalococcoidia bacterium]MDD5493920.1 exo-alpha-sialidase [Dehalococcoidia bacterium]
MPTSTRSYRPARRAPTVIFSLLVVIASLITPLVTALPVYAAWGAEIRLTNAAGNSKEPSVAVSGNIVHVVWFDSRDGNDEIYYRRSLDGGATWGADTRLTDNSSVSDNPSIAVSGSNIHIAWYDQRDGDAEIYYKRSLDGGATWGADTRLTDCLGNSYTPSIAVSGNTVHVAWHDERTPGNEEIYYKRSTDGGTTWDPDTRLTNAAGTSALASIAVSGNNVHVAWQDNRDGNWEIYYTHSIDGGVNFDPGTRLTDAAGESKYPSIAVSGNNVHVAWHDERSGNLQIYYKRSFDGGTIWGADTQIVSSPGLSERPSIAVWGNIVHITWQDNRGEYYPRWEIYYKRSIDGGTAWGAETRLSYAPDNSEVPVIAVSGNNVHVAWQDMRDGNYEIYYKKYTPIPTIASFSPASGGAGTAVVITGTDFIGTAAVSFGGVPVASFTVNSGTQITAITANGANGNIIVITQDGIATSPTIFSFMAPVTRVNQNTTTHGSSVTGTATPTTPQSPVPLSSISVRSAALSVIKVTPGTPVTVTADVVNAGTANGSSSIRVYVNGKEEASQGVTVKSGSSTPLTFNISRSEPGTYSVYVGSASAGSFVVDQFADPNIILYVSGAMLLFAFAIGVIYITGRKQSGR